MQNKATKMVEAMRLVVVAAQQPPLPEAGVPYVGRLTMTELGQLAQACLEVAPARTRCFVAGCENEVDAEDGSELCEPCRSFLGGMGGERSAAAELAHLRVVSEMERDLLQTLLAHVLRRPGGDRKISDEALSRLMDG